MPTHELKYHTHAHPKPMGMVVVGMGMGVGVGAQCRALVVGQGLRIWRFIPRLRCLGHDHGTRRGKPNILYQMASSPPTPLGL